MHKEEVGMPEILGETGPSYGALSADGESRMNGLVRLPFVRREQYLRLKDVEKEREKRQEAEKYA